MGRAIQTDQRQFHTREGAGSLAVGVSVLDNR